MFELCGMMHVQIHYSFSANAGVMWKLLQCTYTENGLYSEVGDISDTSSAVKLVK